MMLQKVNSHVSSIWLLIPCQLNVQLLAFGSITDSHFWLQDLFLALTNELLYGGLAEGGGFMTNKRKEIIGHKPKAVLTMDRN
jgi:hypothetical protein